MWPGRISKASRSTSGFVVFSDSWRQTTCSSGGRGALGPYGWWSGNRRCLETRWPEFGRKRIARANSDSRLDGAGGWGSARRASTILLEKLSCRLDCKLSDLRVLEKCELLTSSEGIQLLRSESDLKITGVEAIYLRLPQVKTQCDSGQDALIVKVSTDAGIIGYGEVDSNPMAVKGCIEGPFSHTTATGLAHVLIGEDPFQTEYLWHKMYRANIYGGRRGIGIHAMSGIDLALWDIKGKALGLPVWKLLGGGFAKTLRAYASSLFGETPAETGRARPAVRRPGLHGSQVRLGPDGPGSPRPTSPWCARLAPGSGRELDLMIDAGLVYDAKTAIQRARAVRAIRSVLVRGAAAAGRLRGLRQAGGGQPACGSRPARRRASGSRSCSSWTSARSTSCRST